jgi:periplasmic protein TonB
MFDEALLDSSPSRAPVLKNSHWLLSIGIGVVGFLIWYFVAPIAFLVSFESNSAAIVQSILFGAVPFLVTSLILCYVYSDAKHLGFNVWGWFVLCLVFNLLGLLAYLLYTAFKTDDWKRATIPIAYILEVILIGVMVLIPLIYTEALPKTMVAISIAAPPPPPPPPPPPAPAAPVRVIRQVTAQDLMRAPTVIPKTIAQIKDQATPPPQASIGVVGGVPGGMPGGAVGGVLGSILTGAAPPPPPPPKAETPKRIRVGGNVEAAKAIFKPSPEYPPLAKMARIQGTVRLAAVISKDGTIQDLKMLSGHPLLVKSAMEAVQRWRYQPTLLNGEPVEVETEIDVNFTLAD